MTLVLIFIHNNQHFFLQILPHTDLTSLLLHTLRSLVIFFHSFLFTSLNYQFSSLNNLSESLLYPQEEIWCRLLSSIKDRNGIDLTEAEDIKKRWQEYTEELYKKHLHDPDNHNGVITHLKPDTLECEVKWALGSIIMNKGNGCDGILVELFQILEDDTVKVLHSICQQIWNTQQWP